MDLQVDPAALTGVPTTALSPGTDGQVLATAAGAVSWQDPADPSSSNELNTTFAVNGTNLELTDAGGTLPVPLADIAAATNTDEQDLTASFATNTLTLGLTGDPDPTNNAPIDLSSINTDAQDLTASFALDTLTLGLTGDADATNNAAIDLSTLKDNLGNHTATQNLDLSTFKLVGDSKNSGTSGTEGIAIDASGNVGIGTTSPTHKLSIVGTTSINDRTISINSTPAVYMPDQGIAVGQFDGSLAIGDGLRSLSNTTASEGRYNTAVGLGALYSNTTGSYNTANGTYALYSNTTGRYNTANGKDALRSSTAGDFNTATGVNALYDYQGGSCSDATYTTEASCTGAGGTWTASDNNTALGYNTGRGIVTGANNTILGANVTGLSATLSNNIIIADGNGNRRINVDALGNVGIGTTTPASYNKLEVAGNNVSIGANNTTAATYRTREVSGTDIKGSDLIIRAGSSTGNGASGQVRLFPGLQSSTSGSSLNRQDASKGLYIANESIGFDNHPNIYRLNAVLGNSANEGNKSGLTTVGTTLTLAGGVSALEIVGASNTLSGGQGFIRFYGSSQANPYATIRAHTFDNDYTSGGLRFNTYNSGVENTTMTIRANGNVGIGTTTPTEALDVVGNIVASGTITPDYVFQKYYTGSSSLKDDYRLASLEEVEDFVSTNHHLPGVPSAKEVSEKGGIVINRATEINLEKIEELFIHLIELKKENEALKARVEALEQK